MQSPNSVRASDAANGRRPSRLKLWLLIALCAAPVVASYIAYYVWQPSGHINYGELLEPRPLPDAALTAIDGSAFRFADLKGSWVLLLPAGAQCDERCRAALVYMRQIRLAQGKEAERVDRVWLLTDDAAPPVDVVGGLPGMKTVRARDSAVLRTLPPDAAGRIHVVDPLGNLMMRFPADPDPSRVLRDLARLLRHSKWK